ncbi:hypothetical protein BBJ29_000923 [Phytophthora kernoviae]|uniref:Uncharacterized protein n=1 Tax=Phytophthora kernoviae TaxID=325452 RepID=A0A3F2RXC7_9STRA|nr:hypothetical protein BBJ29_000923 [Phytophthora kernoviae]RLN66094.1 hypothetical protein BBP00_00002452 [Phytophthora kernoviae]
MTSALHLSLFSVALLLLPRDVSAETKLVSACSSTLSDRDAPVLGSLRAVIGDFAADLFVGVLAESAASKFILSETVDTCAAALEMLDIPLVQYAVGNFTLALSSSGSGDSATDTFIQGLGLVDEGDVEQMCSLYVDGLVPCLRSQLLPSLATLRSTSASGCCAAWEEESVALFDYTITGQYTKMAQLLGDVLCATQTPAFNGTSSQRCGYTFLESLGEVANTTSVDRAATLLEDLQVPTDQACLKAEGEAYGDTGGNAVAAVSSGDYTTSGCVVALDRFATWINSLPLAGNSSESYGIDLQSLFGSGQCVGGADVSPVIQDFFPDSATDFITTSFSGACIHVPIKYADSCSFSRPASLVDWNYEPAHASQAGSSEDGDGNSALNSLNTVPPNVTASSAAISTLVRGAGSTVGTLLVSFTLLALW